MKQKLVLAAGLCAAMFSCQSKTYKIDGSFPESQDLNGKQVYIMTVNEENPRGVKLDSSKIEANKFHFEGELTDSISNLENLMLIAEGFRTPFIIEAGEIKVAMEDVAAKGTAQNDELFAYLSQDDSLRAIFNNRAKELEKALADSLITLAEGQAQMQSLVDSLTKVSKEQTLEVFKKHNNDQIGAKALSSLLGSDASDEEINEWKAIAGEKVLNNFQLKAFFKNLEKKQETAVGKMFKDFEGVNDKGEAVKLSDYVGKGKYVLVDFWASWCGPCRRELPNLKEIRKQYSEEQLTIVGVAVWDKMDAHLKAVEEEKVTWAQIVNEKEATELYGIKGIPQIMLFAPDGTIAARDLRGEAIVEKLKEVIK